MSPKLAAPKTRIASSIHPAQRVTINHSAFDALPDSAFVRESQLVQSPKRPDTPAPLPFSAPTLWRRVKNGTWPKPVKLSQRVSAWIVGECRAMNTLLALAADASATRSRRTSARWAWPARRSARRWARRSPTALVFVDLGLNGRGFPDRVVAQVKALQVVERPVALIDGVLVEPGLLELAIDIAGEHRVPVVHGLAPALRIWKPAWGSVCRYSLSRWP